MREGGEVTAFVSSARTPTAWLAALVCLLTVAPTLAAPIVVSGVPSYNWHHGCGPTAVGMILGYWDAQGYGDLFDAAGPDLLLTANVGEHISSAAHNKKYNSNPDRWDLPIPPMTSIADFFRTSVGALAYGWSYHSFADDAFVGYAAYRGYEFASVNQNIAEFGWDGIKTEIDAQRPFMLLVDTNADGASDHFIPTFGYDERGDGGRYLAVYDGYHEDESVSWLSYAVMAPGVSWGIGYVTTAVPLTVIIPVPALFSPLVLIWPLLRRPAPGQRSKAR
jgi:hypothetical protein